MESQVNMGVDLLGSLINRHPNRKSMNSHLFNRLNQGKSHLESWYEAIQLPRPKHATKNWLITR